MSEHHSTEAERTQRTVASFEKDLVEFRDRELVALEKHRRTLEELQKHGFDSAEKHTAAYLVEVEKVQRHREAFESYMRETQEQNARQTLALEDIATTLRCILERQIQS